MLFLELDFTATEIGLVGLLEHSSRFSDETGLQIVVQENRRGQHSRLFYLTH